MRFLVTLVVQKEKEKKKRETTNSTKFLARLYETDVFDDDDESRLIVSVGDWVSLLPEWIGHEGRGPLRSAGLLHSRFDQTRKWILVAYEGHSLWIIIQSTQWSSFDWNLTTNRAHRFFHSISIDRPSSFLLFFRCGQILALIKYFTRPTFPLLESTRSREATGLPASEWIVDCLVFARGWPRYAPNCDFARHV